MDQFGVNGWISLAGLNIEEAVKQWRTLKGKSLDDIFYYIKNSEDAVRYVYTEKSGWIDLQHFFGTLKYGYGAMYGLEVASGNEYIRRRYLGENAEKSYFSYEDLPSNYLAGSHSFDFTEWNPMILDDVISGEELISTAYGVFIEAGATEPELAPNWEQIPYKSYEDREALPEYWPGDKKEAVGGDQKQKLLSTGCFIPQNFETKPYDLKDFAPAPSSIQNGDNRCGKTGH